MDTHFYEIKDIFDILTVATAFHNWTSQSIVTLFYLNFKDRALKLRLSGNRLIRNYFRLSSMYIYLETTPGHVVTRICSCCIMIQWKNDAEGNGCDCLQIIYFIWRYPIITLPDDFLDALNDVIPNITQLTCGITVVFFMICRSIAIINENIFQFSYFASVNPFTPVPPIFVSESDRHWFR